MAAEVVGANELLKVVGLLGAAVVMVPLFRRLGLGSVLGYLTAGLLVGPFGLRWFNDPQAVLHLAELGVVLFLFVIGLEMRPSHLWSLRRQIFGLGALQIAACAGVLSLVGLALGLAPMAAFIGAMGFVLTSTAIVMQLLAERGDVALPHGQKMVSILLFEDLLIVPLLALVAFLAPDMGDGAGTVRWTGIAVGIASLAGLVVAGLWLLNPLFRILARSRAREVMTAAALLVVLGAALLMQLGGLSMAMGAFLAGVLLSESAFRHQIEADIEPFRGLLLGLFFLAVGMALDLSVVARDWPLVVSGVLALMTAKGACIYLVARLLRSPHPEALDRAVLMAQGGEFAFVLYAAAAGAGLIAAEANAAFTAMIVLSMVLTPIVVLLLRRCPPSIRPSMEGIELAGGQSGSVLIVGFGRFGQVASQALLARGVDVTIIDTDVDMIRSAGEFGFKVYYGDGTRLDVLQACGAGQARVIAMCVDDRAATDRMVELVRHAFPQARMLARAYDREHALTLVGAGVHAQVRETFDGALRLGELALRALGVDEDEAAGVAAEIRRRDAERFALELTGGFGAGRDLLLGNAPRPAPLTPPARPGRLLNPGDAVGAAPGSGALRQMVEVAGIEPASGGTPCPALHA